MHEITPSMEQTLLEQGFTQEDVDELRRTGRIERIDESDDTIMSLELGPDGELTSDVRQLAEEPEPYLDPDSVLGALSQHVADRERDNGVDIDGDGVIGSVRGFQLADGEAAAKAAPTAPAASGDPFVARRGPGIARIVLAVALLAIVVLVATRTWS